MKIVNILTFHHVSEHLDDLTVPADVFEKTLQILSKKYNFISYDDFKSYLFNEKKLPKKSLLLTFDDGYLDNFLYAFPVLKKLNIPAVVFIVTKNIEINNKIRTSLPCIRTHKELKQNPDKKLFINTGEMQIMENSSLVAFESHTDSHISCEGKTKKELKDEFEKSLVFIKSYTSSKEPYGFCWPKGRFDDMAMEIIKKSEYKFAFSTLEGAFCKGDDPFAIRRVDCSSYSGSQKEYIKRVIRKLCIYSNPFISRPYMNFRESRIKIKKFLKNKVKNAK